MALSGGCLYIAPLVPLNEPPIILEPDVAPDEEVPFDLAQSSYLIVVGEDPDSEEVQCFWTLDASIVPEWTCDRDGPLVITNLVLPYDPELDGRAAVAHLFDAEARVDVTVTFRLAASPEEGP